MTEHDIVQITNSNHKWYPCLIVVSENKRFGIQGYITMPTNDNKPNGQAYIKLNTGDYKKVGEVVIAEIDVFTEGKDTTYADN